MRLYRCYACTSATGEPGKDFEGNEPVCPTCRSKGPAIAERVVIHFDPPSGIPGRGLRVLACQPHKPIGQGEQFTGLPAIVNCPACRCTDAWLKADKAYSFDPRLDVPIIVTPDGPVPDPIPTA